MIRFIAILALALLSACATTTDKNYAALLATQESIATSRAEAEKARYAAIAEIARGGDPSSRTAAVMALALGGGSSSQQLNLPAPPEDSAYKWAALILGPVTNIASGYFGYRLGVSQSDNQAASTIASYQTFGSMGGSIERAGIAGYPYLQAPAANVTTTTLSGSGVIGAGSYVGPVTTTRNCAGGNGAPGGNGGGGATTGGPGAIGGSGGAATC